MKKVTIAALMTLGLGGLAFSAMADHHRGGMAAEADLNQDGNLTKDEIAAHRAARFLDADTDGDNLVSAAEFEAFAEAERERRQDARRARRFAKLDANGDGQVSAEEHAAAADKRSSRMFDRIDADGDGVLTEAERDAAKEKMRERRGKHRRGGRG